MITAVDSNVLLDVFGADPTFGMRSKAALARCLAEGSIVACEVVWAEIGGVFSTSAGAEHALESIGAQFVPLNRHAALGAASAWRTYRHSGGRRTRVMADFLIGAHAAVQSDRLLTRDRGFYRSHFGELAVLDPSV